jgi:hypothetical protein
MTKFLKVHFTHAKVFQHHNGIAEQRFQVVPGVNTQVPLWVKETLGWTMGVKDGSIVDLTPPDPSMFVAKAPDPAPEVEEETGEDEEKLDEEKDGEEEVVVTAKPSKKPRNTHGLQK